MDGHERAIAIASCEKFQGGSAWVGGLGAALLLNLTFDLILTLTFDSNVNIPFDSSLILFDVLCFSSY